jgi:hypothetical protein
VKLIIAVKFVPPVTTIFVGAIGRVVTATVEDDGDVPFESVALTAKL